MVGLVLVGGLLAFRRGRLRLRLWSSRRGCLGEAPDAGLLAPPLLVQEPLFEGSFVFRVGLVTLGGNLALRLEQGEVLLKVQRAHVLQGHELVRSGHSVLALDLQILCQPVLPGLYSCQQL